jgi:hypothetical protein
MTLLSAATVSQAAEPAPAGVYTAQQAQQGRALYGRRVYVRSSWGNTAAPNATAATVAKLRGQAR